MSRSRRVLLTGGFGFIGAAITRRLVKEGHTVLLLELGSGDLGRLDGVIDSVTVKDIDLRDNDSVMSIVKDFGPDIIVHLAAYYAVEHRPGELPPMVGTNVLGLANLLEAARAAGLQNIINTSSCFVYEQTGMPLAEHSSLRPVNLYAMTKRFGEELCTFFCENYGLNALTFRIFSPYGPADHERRLIPSVIKSYCEGTPPKVSTGKQKWDFIYIDDIVDAYVRALDHEPKGHEIFNIGSGKSVAVGDIVRKIKELLGSGSEPMWGAIPHRKNETWSLTADISAARSRLQWEPRTDIMGEGLEKTVNWFLKKYGRNGS